MNQHLELGLLRLRNLICQQEMLVEGAKRETLHLGGWTCNWNQPHAELQEEIDNLIADLKHLDD